MKKIGLQNHRLKFNRQIVRILSTAEIKSIQGGGETHTLAECPTQQDGALLAADKLAIAAPEKLAWQR